MMIDKRREDGLRYFQRDETLTASQIQSYFSRKFAKQGADAIPRAVNPRFRRQADIAERERLQTEIWNEMENNEGDDNLTGTTDAHILLAADETHEHVKEQWDKEYTD